MSKRYVIIKNKVWLEIIYKETPIGTRCVFTGENKKECKNWILERGLNYENA